MFRKTQSSHPDDFFQAEIAGLQWLKDGGLPVPVVFAYDAHSIEMEKLFPGIPTWEKAHTFGQKLAACHRSGASHFGSKPTDYTGGLYIGNKAMPSKIYMQWGEFYAKDRILPFIPQAERLGMLNSTDAQDTYHACDIIHSGIFNGQEPPSRIHGDLWSGNVFYGETQVYAIDPAAHGGHRETDLAMLQLFGCPYVEAIIEGYLATYPLTVGWQARIPLHQMHPLAVHAAGQGAHYGRALGKAARHVIQLAESYH